MVQFASYLRRVLCKTRLIFPRINGPNALILYNSPFLALRVLGVRGGIPGQGEEGEGAGGGVALDSLYL